jgi:hypothetical protein
MEQESTVTKTRFATKPGTLVWTDMPGRIRVEDAPLRRRLGKWCWALVVLALSLALWGWIVFKIARGLGWL